MGDDASACVLGPTPVVLLAPPPQEPPEVAPRAFVVPDHLVNPFVAKEHPALTPQPETQLLRTPAFRPQLTSEGATDMAHQLVRQVSNLRHEI